MHELGIGINTEGVKAFVAAIEALGEPGYIGQTAYMLWRQLDELMCGSAGLMGQLARHHGVYPSRVKIVCAKSTPGHDQELCVSVSVSVCLSVSVSLSF
eukprot:COSAG03_NODE_269_length_9603_cov_225.864927_9_plen_99_part_00